MGERAIIRAEVAGRARLPAGVVIILKGVGKIEYQQNDVGTVLIAVGIAFALIAFFHEKLSIYKTTRSRRDNVRFSLPSRIFLKDKEVYPQLMRHAA